MNAISILILVGVAILIALAIFAIKRGKSGCCDDCENCGKSSCKTNDYFKDN